MKFTSDHLARRLSMRRIQSRHPDSISVLAQLMKTREVREMLAKSLPEILVAYAGNHPLKRLIAGFVSAHVQKSLLRPEDGLNRDELAELFSDAGFVAGLFDHVSGFFGHLFPLISSTLLSIEKMPENERKEIIEKLIPKDAAGQAAGILTTLFRILNQLHDSDPEFFAKRLEPAVFAWIESFDFAELKDAVEKSEPDIDAFVKTASFAMWKYPTKVVLLLSLIPNLMNIISRSTQTILSGFNALPPDLLADVMNSFVEEIDGVSISRVVNELAELVRKFDTGSSLIGDSGSPAFQRVVARLASDIVPGLDAKVFKKAWTGLARTRVAVRTAFREAINDTPDIRKALYVAKVEEWNISVRSENNALAFIEALDDKELCEGIADNLGLADVQEMAEAMNRFLSVFNRVCEQRPALSADLAGRFADFVDTYELAEAARHVRKDAAPGFKGVARAFVPDLVIWMCDVLAPEDDENEDRAARARQALARLMKL